MVNITETNRKPDAEFGNTTHNSVSTESAAVTNEVDAGSVNAEDSVTVGEGSGEPSSFGGDVTMEQDLTVFGEFDAARSEDDFAYVVGSDESLQDAIDQAEADGVGVVYAPSRVYDGPITVPGGMRVTGASATSPSPGTRIDLDDDEDAVVTVVSGGDRRAIFENFLLLHSGGGPALEVSGDGRSIVRGSHFNGSEVVITGGSTENRIVQNHFDGGSITIDDRRNIVANNHFKGGSATINDNDNVVIGNTRLSDDDITDNASGNEILGNSQ